MKATVATKTELAKMYNIHYNTFIKWLADIPGLGLDPKKRLLTPKQVEIIFLHLGEP